MTCAREVAARWIRWSVGGVAVGLLVLAACSKKEAANETAAPGAEAAAPAAAAQAGEPSEAAEAGDEESVPGGKHPCDLLSAAQIQAVVGFDPGKSDRLGASCQYTEVKLFVNDPTTFDGQRAGLAQSTPVTDLPGLGDAAFMYDAGPATQVNIRKGDVYVAASIIKEIPAAKRHEMAKAVAAELLKAATK